MGGGGTGTGAGTDGGRRGVVVAQAASTSAKSAAELTRAGGGRSGAHLTAHRFAVARSRAATALARSYTVMA